MSAAQRYKGSCQYVILIYNKESTLNFNFFSFPSLFWILTFGLNIGEQTSKFSKQTMREYRGAVQIYVLLVIIYFIPGNKKIQKGI